MPVAVDYPMLPLLDMTLFPWSETSLFVGRALSRASVEAAVAGSGELVVETTVAAIRKETQAPR